LQTDELVAELEDMKMLVNNNGSAVRHRLSILINRIIKEGVELDQRGREAGVPAGLITMETAGSSPAPLPKSFK